MRSKHIERIPIAIAVTMGLEVIQANGGLLRFIRHFEDATRGEEGSYWYHKCKNRPTFFNIPHVYVIVCNQVRYRVLYGGNESGPTSVFMRWGEERKIDWPRLILAGPFEKAPRKIEMRGFQGFRYVYDPIF